MALRDVSRSPRGLRGDPSGSGDDSILGSYGAEGTMWHALREVRRENLPNANDFIRMDDKIDRVLMSLNECKGRIRALEEKVGAQSELLAQQRKELDEWQRWWTRYGESMCWYFYYRYYYQPQPLSMYDWCRKQKPKSQSTSSWDENAGWQQADESMLAADTRATSFDPGAAAVDADAHGTTPVISPTMDLQAPQ